MDISIDIAVEDAAWSCLPDIAELARRAVDAAAAQSDADIEAGAELSLVLCDDAFIQGLNKSWRGKDKPTNVLSFPTEESMLLGDIVIAYETTAAEALDEGKTLADHFTHLVVHGFLHLIGFDHEDDDEAEEMERLETRVLKSIGLASPYSDAEDARATP